MKLSEVAPVGEETVNRANSIVGEPDVAIAAHGDAVRIVGDSREPVGGDQKLRKGARGNAVGGRNPVKIGGKGIGGKGAGGQTADFIGVVLREPKRAVRTGDNVERIAVRRQGKLRDRALWSNGP